MTPPEAPLLDVRGLRRSFGGLLAINEVTMALHAGVVTALVGPNGAGKTTLFNLITGYLAPDGGEVRWKGRPLAGLPHWAIARLGIARTFQDLRLFTHMSVEDNVLTVMERNSWLWQPGGGSAKRARGRRTAAILEATGLADRARTRAIDLAYAERKFLSLARIMATDAELWLLDEPASGLDLPSYGRFLELVRGKAREGITVCIIEHNLEIVQRISDRILFLDQGRVIANGEPKAILADPHLASLYFGDQPA
ncbi:MAG: ABC transporter ATP-binding protein [Alphaproteobacteria bacterium]